MRFGLRKVPVEPAEDPRRSERHDLSVPATIIMATGDTHDVVVENLSTTGFRAAAGSVLAVGANFRISLIRGSARHARVIWRKDGMVGCEFLAPLDAAELAG